MRQRSQVLCRHHGCELELPFYPPYRFLNRGYRVFDCGGMAFQEASLIWSVRMCFSPLGEPVPVISFCLRFRSHLLAAIRELARTVGQRRFVWGIRVG